MKYLLYIAVIVFATTGQAEDTVGDTVSEAVEDALCIKTTSVTWSEDARCYFKKMKKNYEKTKEGVQESLTGDVGPETKGKMGMPKKSPIKMDYKISSATSDVMVAANYKVKNLKINVSTVSTAMAYLQEMDLDNTETLLTSNLQRARNKIREYVDLKLEKK